MHKPKILNRIVNRETMKFKNKGEEVLTDFQSKVNE